MKTKTTAAVLCSLLLLLALHGADPAPPAANSAAKPDPLALTIEEKFNLMEAAYRTVNARMTMLDMTLRFEKLPATGKEHDDLLEQIGKIHEQIGAFDQMQNELMAGLQRKHNCEGCVLRSDYVFERPEPPGAKK